MPPCRAADNGIDDAVAIVRAITETRVASPLVRSRFLYLLFRARLASASTLALSSDHRVPAKRRKRLTRCALDGPFYSRRPRARARGNARRARDRRGRGGEEMTGGAGGGTENGKGSDEREREREDDATVKRREEEEEERTEGEIRESTRMRNGRCESRGAFVVGADRGGAFQTEDAFGSSFGGLVLLMSNRFKCFFDLVFRNGNDRAVG